MQSDRTPLPAERIGALAQEGCARWPKSEVVDVLYYQLTALPAGSFVQTSALPSCADFAPHVDRTSGLPMGSTVRNVQIWLYAYLSGFDAAMDQRRVTGRTDDGLAYVSFDGDFQTYVLSYCLDHPLARLDAAADAWLLTHEIFWAWHAKSPALDASGPAPQGYEPPNAARLETALAAVEDASGSTALADQLVAYDLVMDDLSFGRTRSAERATVARGFFASRFMTRVQRAMGAVDAIPTPIPTEPDRRQGRLDRFDALSPGDQAIVFDQKSRTPGAAVRRFASPASYRANLEAHVALARAIESQRFKNGATTRTLALQRLEALQSDPGNETDAWTARATAELRRYPN